MSETVGTSTTPPQLDDDEGIIKSRYENQPRRKSAVVSADNGSNNSVVSAAMKESTGTSSDVKRINSVNRRKSTSDGLDQSIVRKMVMNRRKSMVTSPTSSTKRVLNNSLDTTSLLKKYDFLNDDLDNDQDYEYRDFNDENPNDSIHSNYNPDESVNSIKSVTFYPSFGVNQSNNARKGSVRKSFVNLSSDNDSDYENSELSELSPIQSTSKQPTLRTTAMRSKNVESSTNTSPLMTKSSTSVTNTENKEDVDHKSVHMQLKAAAALLLDAVEEQGRLKALLSYTDKTDVSTGSTDLQLRLTGALIELEAAVNQSIKWRSQCDAATTRADDAERALEVIKTRLSEVELERDNFRNEVKELKRQQLLGSPPRVKGDAMSRRVLGGVPLPLYSNLHSDNGIIPPPIESPPPEAADDYHPEESESELAKDHVILTVEVDGNRCERLVILPNSDPITLAFEFLKEHALPPEYLEPLIKYISMTQATKFENTLDKQPLNDSTDTTSRTQNTHDSSNESNQSLMYLSPSSTETDKKKSNASAENSVISPLSDTPNTNRSGFTAAMSPPINSPDTIAMNNSLSDYGSPVPPPPAESPLSAQDVTRSASNHLDFTVSSASSSDVEYDDVDFTPKKPTSPLQEAQLQYEKENPFVGLSPDKYTYMNLSEKFKHDPSGIANDSDLQILAAVEKEAIEAFKEQEKILDIIHQSKYEANIPADIIPTSPLKAPMSKFSTAVEYFDRASSLANAGDLVNAVPLYHYALKMFETAGIKNLKLIREEVDYWTDILQKNMTNTQEYTPEPSFATKYLEKTISSGRISNSNVVNRSNIKTPISGGSKKINKQSMLLSPDE